MPIASTATPGHHSPPVAPAAARFDQAERLVDHERKRHHRDATDQHGDPVFGLQSGKDEVAKARLPDRGRQRRHADGPHRGGADASHDHRRGERQLDPEQFLAARHADAVGGLEISGVDAEQRGDAVAQDRQHRIDRERQERRQEAECRHAQNRTAAGHRRQAEQQRIEQRQQREARYGLHEACDREHRQAQPRSPRRHDRQRQADRDAERQRGGAQQHMLCGIVRQQRQRARRAAHPWGLPAAGRGQRADALRLAPRHRHQRRDLGIAVAGEQRRRRVIGDDAAGAHHHDPVGEQHGFLHVMRDHHGGHAEPIMQRAIGRAERIAGHRIECAERLVHQHDARPRRNGAGDAGALALAARQRVRESASQNSAAIRRGRAIRRRGRRSRPAAIPRAAA